MAKRLLPAVTLTILALFLAIPAPSQAEISLMDGKLILSGFIKNTTYYRLNGYDREFKKGRNSNSNHDTKFDFSNFSTLIEALYTINEDQESTLRIFGGFKAWYEMSTRYDDSLKRGMNSDDRKNHQAPQRFDDVVSELYLDYITGPWQVRVGKQIVIWGQLDMSRVADVVNPLDLRLGVPGVDTWEEVKRGLWMIRTFYQSQLPGNLLFEFILNPGYYASFELPYQGTHWGSETFKNWPAPYDKVRDRGYFSWMTEKWRRDEPSTWALDNYEIGGRVQGYTWDIDWTFLVWNAKDDAPGTADVEGAYLDTLAYFNLFGGGAKPKHANYEIYKYERYTTVGGTAQTFTNFLNTVWRLEWFWEINRPIIKGFYGNTQNLYDRTTANILGIAVQGNWNIDIPWFTQVIGTGKQASFNLTYFNERVLDYDKDMCLADRNYKYGKSTVDYFSMFFMQAMFNQAWTFVFMGSYIPDIGKWMAVPSFSYMFSDSGPFSGFRLELGLKLYGGAKHKYSDPDQNGLSHASDKKDSVIMRLRYEF